MTNQLTTLPKNAVDINKMFGFEGKPIPILPILKINGSDEDEGITAPKGTFVYDNGKDVLYSTEVTIRTFLKGLQYRLYHPTDKTQNDFSIIANSFRAEFRSASGRIACGKLPKKQYAELGDNASTQQKHLQDNVKCKLILFGLISGKFTNVETKEEVTLEDELFIWVTSQSSFMPLDQAVTGIEKERRPVPCTPIKIKLKKEKNGSVTYYTPIPEVLKDSIELNAERDIPKLEKIKQYVVDTNKHIDDKYNAAIKDKNMDKYFANLGEILEGKIVKDTGFSNDPLEF